MTYFALNVVFFPAFPVLKIKNNFGLKGAKMLGSKGVKILFTALPDTILLRISLGHMDRLQGLCPTA